MDNETQLGSDEFSVLIELIITIFFMTIGALYTGVMVTRMNTFAELTYDKDKIDITNAEHITHDPYYMTGYGAIMLGWVYDNQSEVPVSWLGRSNSNGYGPDTSNTYISDMQIPDSIDAMNENNASINYVTLSSVHKDGSPMENFKSQKPQIIAGSSHKSSIGYYHNVLSTIRSAAGQASLDTNILPLNQNDPETLYHFYRGNFVKDNGDGTKNHYLYHLEYTHDYTSTIDTTDFIEKRRSQWLLVPRVLRY